MFNKYPFLVCQILFVFCLGCAEIIDPQPEPQTVATSGTGQDIQSKQRRSRMSGGDFGSGGMGLPPGAGPDLTRMQEMRDKMFGGGFASGNMQDSSDISTSTRGETDESKKLIKLGKKLFEKQQYNQAALEFETFLSKYEYHDLSPDALYYLGECYYKQEKYKQAIKVCKKVEQLYRGYPLTPNAVYRIAKCYEKLGQPKISQKTLKRLKINFPHFDSVTIKPE